MASPAGAARFQTTQWSLVLAAGTRGTSTAEEALARLCSIYWYPVFAFIRRRGHDTDDAQELTQSFFTRLVEKNDVGMADRARGRFRTFLLTSCEHFLANQRDRDRRIKRGGGVIHIPIEMVAAEERYERQCGHDETPERVYQREWTLTLLDSVLKTLRAEYEAAGNARVFERLAGFLTYDESAGTYVDAGRDLDMTPAAVKVATYRLRNRFRDALRESVADTVASAADVDDEIRYLLQTLERPNSNHS